MVADVPHSFKRKLAMETALGLKPADNSNFRIQINFCCLMAKHYIWICRSKERHPTQNNFSFFLKHIHRMEIRHRQVIYGNGATSALAGSSLLNPES